MPEIILACLGIRKLCGNNRGYTGIIARARTYCACKVHVGRVGSWHGPTAMEPTERPPESEGEGTILTLLQAPRASEFARRQNLKTNPAVPGKRRYLPKTAHNPDEPLTVSSRKLFCRACWEEVELKKSVIENHIKRSRKHVTVKDILRHKQQLERDTAEALREYSDEKHVAGEQLPKEQQVFRVQVVSTFLKSGNPNQNFSTASRGHWFAIGRAKGYVRLDFICTSARGGTGT